MYKWKSYGAELQRLGFETGFHAKPRHPLPEMEFSVRMAETMIDAIFLQILVLEKLLNLFLTHQWNMRSIFDR